MAPEFFPLFICIGLVAAIFVIAILAIFVQWPQRFLNWLFPHIVKHLRAILILVLIGFVGALGLTVYNIKQQYFLNEPMAGAAAAGDLHEVQKLLDKGADADAWGIDFVDTALTGAADGGHVDVVELLLKHGADPSLRDSNGVTPLQHARENGHDDVAEILIKAGAIK